MSNYSVAYDEQAISRTWAVFVMTYMGCFCNDIQRQMATKNCTATATGFVSAALKGIYDAVGVGLKSIVFLGNGKELVINVECNNRANLM